MVAEQKIEHKDPKHIEFAKLIDQDQGQKT